MRQLFTDDGDSQQARSARGQTTIDFGVGVSLFLLTVVFIFTFVPSLFQPFTSDQSQIITADRTADMLVEDMLLPNTTTAERYVLDRRCTVTFFKQMQGTTVSNPPDDCRFNTSITSPQLMLGLKSYQSVNITLEPADGSKSGIVKLTDAKKPTGSMTRMAIGESPPQQGNVVAAQRAVYIRRANGTADEYRLFVRVW